MIYPNCCLSQFSPETEESCHSYSQLLLRRLFQNALSSQAQMDIQRESPSNFADSSEKLKLVEQFWSS
jgi:hypothetical protein